MSVTSDLTELEGATLAVIRRYGRCTTYKIKRAFSNSPSDYWSGSAGAVYPLVSRLVRRGLVAEILDSTDGRGRKIIELTDAGGTAVDVWFLDLGRTLAPGFDPLRTRLNFKSSVSANLYAQFVDDAEAALVAQLECPPAPPGDHHERAQALYRLWLEARLDWITRARKAGLL